MMYVGIYGCVWRIQKKYQAIYVCAYMSLFPHMHFCRVETQFMMDALLIMTVMMAGVSVIYYDDDDEMIYWHKFFNCCHQLIIIMKKNGKRHKSNNLNTEPQYRHQLEIKTIHEEALWV